MRRAAERAIGLERTSRARQLHVEHCPPAHRSRNERSLQESRVRDDAPCCIARTMSLRLYTTLSVAAVVGAVGYAAWTRHSFYAVSVFLWTSKLTILVGVFAPRGVSLSAVVSARAHTRARARSTRASATHRHFHGPQLAEKRSLRTANGVTRSGDDKSNARRRRAAAAGGDDGGGGGVFAPA